MGRGNFCPAGEMTFQWYIDNDEYVYWDEDGNKGIDFDLMLMDIDFALENVQKRYPSFHDCERWVDHYWGQKDVLENKMFEIGIADNGWSYAIYIRERDDLDSMMMNLAKGMFPLYRDSVQAVLLDWFGELYLRNGPWMSSRLTKETEVAA